jgi:Fe-S cluster biosynthesis and repair protein YggX
MLMKNVYILSKPYDFVFRSLLIKLLQGGKDFSTVAHVTGACLCALFGTDKFKRGLVKKRTNLVNSSLLTLLDVRDNAFLHGEVRKFLNGRHIFKCTENLLVSKVSII